MFGSSSTSSSGLPSSTMMNKDNVKPSKRRLVKGAFSETRAKRQIVALPKLGKNFMAESDKHNKAIKEQKAAAAASSLKPVYKRESSLGKRRTGSIKFAAETKSWNGLRVERRLYDELVYQFFVEGKQFSSVDVLRLIGMDSTVAGGINVQLLDLCQRIKDQIPENEGDSENGVPVLLYGGGHGLKVTSFHLPYLQSLQLVVAEAERVVSLGFSLDDKQKQ